jgi:thiamine-phosphate pyrophosphorylase
VTLSKQSPLIYLITEGSLDPANFSFHKAEVLGIVEAAVRSRVSLIQVREKKLEGRQLYSLVRDAVDIASGSETHILVNERFDIAIAAGAQGVHLPAYGLDVSVVRSAVNTDLLIGVSAHSARDVRDAAVGGADFATFGPIFSSPGKGEPVGIDALRESCGGAPGFPVIALAGISEVNVFAVLDAGAAGIAGIRAFNDVESLVQMVGKLNSGQAAKL